MWSTWNILGEKSNKSYRFDRLTSCFSSVSFKISSWPIGKFSRMPLHQFFGGQRFVDFLKHSSSNPFMVSGKVCVWGLPLLFPGKDLGHLWQMEAYRLNLKLLNNKNSWKINVLREISFSIAAGSINIFLMAYLIYDGNSIAIPLNFLLWITDFFPFWMCSVKVFIAHMHVRRQPRTLSRCQHSILNCPLDPSFCKS